MRVQLIDFSTFIKLSFFIIFSSTFYVHCSVLENVERTHTYSLH